MQYCRLLTGADVFSAINGVPAKTNDYAVRFDKHIRFSVYLRAVIGIRRPSYGLSSSSDYLTVGIIKSPANGAEMAKPAKPAKPVKSGKATKGAKKADKMVKRAKNAKPNLVPTKMASKVPAKAATKPPKNAKEAPKGGVKAAFRAVVKAVTKAVKSSESAKPASKELAKSTPKSTPKSPVKTEKVEIKSTPPVRAISKAKTQVPVKPKPGALRGGPPSEPEDLEQDDVGLDDTALEFAEDMAEDMAEDIAEDIAEDMADVDTDAEISASAEEEDASDDTDEAGGSRVSRDSVNVSDDSATESASAQVTTGPTEKSEKKRKRDEVKFDRGGDIEGQWQVLFDKAKGIKPLPYKMSDNFEARTPLLHKVLGWGYVLSSQNNRLEVLFKDGVKVLIANYKSA